MSYTPPSLSLGAFFILTPACLATNITPLDLCRGVLSPQVRALTNSWAKLKGRADSIVDNSQPLRGRAVLRSPAAVLPLSSGCALILGNSRSIRAKRAGIMSWLLRTHASATAGCKASRYTSSSSSRNSLFLLGPPTNRTALNHCIA